jgi:membrane-bound metal-dependent hydrolase YbcI (DUF457 family)
MYAGHFASALVLKTIKPETPTWALVAGCGLLDLLFGVLVAFGIEGAMPDYQNSHRLNIPWSHSLLMAMVLGTAFAALFHRRGRVVMVVLFTAVISHWVLDVLIHRPDMQLWPQSATQLGFFKFFGPVSGWAETTIVVISTSIYAIRARVATDYGGHWATMCGFIVLLIGLGYVGG